MNSKKIFNTEASQIALKDFASQNVEFPDGIQIDPKPLGKGSNNKVFLMKDKHDDMFILRVPRRRSDNQQKGSALLEMRQTIRAFQLGVAPTIYNVCFARHAKEMWTSGLYFITERYQTDFDDAIQDEETREMLLSNDGSLIDDIGQQTIKHLESMANDDMLVYDLKPSNIVLKFDRNNHIDIKIIDYGRDFCEWKCNECDAELRTPVLDGLTMLISKRSDLSTEDKTRLRRHIAFAVMLTQLSATTTRTLYSDRRSLKISSEERKRFNPFSVHASAFLSTMHGQKIELLKWALRTDEVRGVLRHYNGRRNAGTKRTLDFACGNELTHQ